MRTPTYGVLLLDPSCHSPLELVKSRDTHSACGEGITLCGQRGTSGVNMAESAQGDSQFAAHPASVVFADRLALNEGCVRVKE